MQIHMMRRGASYKTMTPTDIRRTRSPLDALFRLFGWRWISRMEYEIALVATIINSPEATE